MIGAGLAAGAGLKAAAAGIGALKIPAVLKTLFASKYFLHVLLGGGYLLGKGMEAGGQMGERGLSREQMRMQTLLGKTSAEATKMSVKESRARTKEYMTMLTKAKREERGEARDVAAMQSFQQSQDRQMALVLQAVQAVGQRQPGQGGAGMLGMMRGGF